MNGAQHYAEAERLLLLADRDGSENFFRNTGEKKSDVLAAAASHATLALAAATLSAGEENLRWWRSGDMDETNAQACGSAGPEEDK